MAEKEWKRKERLWEIRVRMLEEKDGEKEREVRELRAMIEDMKKETGYDGESVNSGKSGKSRDRSRAASSKGSWGSEISEDRLSIREVGKVRKWIR